MYAYMRVLCLKEASFEVVPYTQFHFRHLQHNILTAMDKQTRLLGSLMCLTYKTKSLSCGGFPNPALESGKPFHPKCLSPGRSPECLLGARDSLGIILSSHQHPRTQGDMIVPSTLSPTRSPNHKPIRKCHACGLHQPSK